MLASCRLRKPSRTEAAHLYVDVLTAAYRSAEGGDSGGSAMPGVRKAKHLKQYTKAQMKAHNGWQ